MAYIGEMQYLTIGNNTYSLPTGGEGSITTEVDPIFSSSPAAGITAADITNWNSKTSNAGTVTSITLTQGTGISIGSSGTAITTSGSRTISLATITKSDTTSTASPAHGGMFTAIDSITYDTYGRVTGVNTKTITLPTDSDTHNTAYLYAGASNGTANAATTNGNTYLILIDGGSATTRRKISGSTNVSVASDSSGNITITGPNLSGYALSSAIPTKTSDLTNDSGFITSYTDTKNTAGSTNSTSKLYLIGALTQEANPQTYSNSGLYFDNGLHSEVTADNIKTWLHHSDTAIGLYRVQSSSQGVFIQLTTESSTQILKMGRTTGSAFATVLKIAGTQSAPTLTLTNLVAPANDTDAATKKYVDDLVGAITIPTKTSDLTNDSGFITSYTDEKVKRTLSTTSNTYYPLQSDSTEAVSTANTLNGISFYQYYNTAGGYRRLNLGNSTAYKATGGAYGTIRLYGSAATYYGDLVPGVLGTTSGDGHISANRTWTLPDKTGTIALTSDIPTISYPVTSVNNKTGAVSLTASDVGALPSTTTIPSITLNGSSSTSPSFYAPTGAGTNGQYLKSNGSGAPSWTNFPTIPSITLNGSSTTSPSFYAPTSAGTSGYFLKSNGSGAPTWSAKPSYVASDIEVDTGTFVDYTVDVALDDIDYDIKNNYLPLSAGSTKPLSGDLYAENNLAIRGKTSGLDTDIYLNAFQACNSNNNLTIGYGGYDNQIGGTNIYGDYIRLYTTHAITSTGYIEYTNKSIGYRLGGIYAKAARPSSNITLTTSNQKISLATSVFGSNNWFTLENGGITVEQECYIRVYGYVYVTNLTAQDAIYMIAAKNGTSMINQYYRATGTTDTFVLMPGFIECDAGDVITLMMRNSTSARGAVQASSFTQFIVEIAGLKS